MEDTKACLIVCLCLLSSWSHHKHMTQKVALTLTDHCLNKTHSMEMLLIATWHALETEGMVDLIRMNGFAVE